jgi:ABC transport system ATP-binding/permease protein
VQAETRQPPRSGPQVAARSATAPPAAPRPRKLGYKDARELQQLPARIEALESRLAELAAAMQDPGFFQREAGEVARDNNLLAQAQAELDAAYARWAQLEG